MRKIGADRKEWDKDNSLKAMESSLILDAFMSPQKTETENGDHFSSRSVHYPRGDTVSQITVPPDPACYQSYRNGPPTIIHQPQLMFPLSQNFATIGEA